MPERPIRRQAIEGRPVLSAGHLDWQANFFGGLSTIAIGMYSVIKERERVEQFETARRDLQSAYNIYNQELDKNPLQADRGTDEEGPVPKFRKDLGTAYEQISKRVTNGAAAREFDSWAADQKVRWSHEAIARATDTYGAIRKATTDKIHSDILLTEFAGQDPAELKEAMDKMEGNITTLRAEGVLTPDEDTQYQFLLQKGQKTLHYNWWSKHLVPMVSPDVYKAELAKSGLDAEQIQNIEAIRAAIKRQADAAKEDEYEKTERQLAVDIVNREVTDPQVVTDLLEQDSIRLGFHNSWRNTMLDAKEPVFDIGKYIEVLNANKDDTLTETQKLGVLVKNLPWLPDTERKELAKAILDADKPDNPLNRPEVKRMSETLTHFKNSGFLGPQSKKKEFIKYADMTTEEQMEANYNWLKIHNEMDRWITMHPESTAEQFTEYCETVLLKSEQDNAAKSLLEKAWEKYWAPFPVPPFGWARFAGLKEPKPEIKIPEESLRAAERLRQRIKAPDARLDRYWNQLTDNQRTDIWLRYNQDPKSIDQILRIIQSAAP